MPWRRRPKASSSSRVSVNFTGRPVLRAANAAQNSHDRSSILPPKPPPTAGLITRTSFSRSPSAAASMHWVMYGICVDVQSVHPAVRLPAGQGRAGLQVGVAHRVHGEDVVQHQVRLRQPPCPGRRTRCAGARSRCPAWSHAARGRRRPWRRRRRRRRAVPRIPRG